MTPATYDPFYNPSLSSILSIPGTSSFPGSSTDASVLNSLPSVQQSNAATIAQQQQAASGNYLTDLIQGFTGTKTSAGAPSPPASLFGLGLSQISFLILGLILIAGGIYLFKPAQEVINSAVKATTRKTFQPI